MPRTLKQLARESLAVQDACNLSGVLHSAAKAASELMDLVPGGTDARNTHPIMVLWADKIAHLTGIQAIGHETVMRAYHDCRALARSSSSD